MRPTQHRRSRAGKDRVIYMYELELKHEQIRQLHDDEDRL